MDYQPVPNRKEKGLQRKRNHILEFSWTIRCFFPHISLHWNQAAEFIPQPPPYWYWQLTSRWYIFSLYTSFNWLNECMLYSFWDQLSSMPQHQRHQVPVKNPGKLLTVLLPQTMELLEDDIQPNFMDLTSEFSSSDRSASILCNVLPCTVFTALQMVCLKSGLWV